MRSQWNGGLAGDTCPGAGWGWGEGGTQAGFGGDKGRGLLMGNDRTWDRSVGGGGVGLEFGMVLGEMEDETGVGWLLMGEGPG